MKKLKTKFMRLRIPLLLDRISEIGKSMGQLELASALLHHYGCQTAAPVQS
jgi:hypothetical protein